jgi:hypothetical protein
MKKILGEIYRYLKNPTNHEDKNKNFSYRMKNFFTILIISLLTGVLISPIFALIGELGFINLENHAMEEIMKNYTKLELFLFAVIMAPIGEELFFRAPITAFKKAKAFKIGFYVFALLFGFIHITNFEMTQNVILLSPILVAPQILIGGYLGFIRVRFGLIWSIALHASYNSILMAISLIPNLLS